MSGHIQTRRADNLTWNIRSRLQNEILCCKRYIAIDLQSSGGFYGSGSYWQITINYHLILSTGFSVNTDYIILSGISSVSIYICQYRRPSRKAIYFTFWIWSYRINWRYRKHTIFGGSFLNRNIIPVFENNGMRRCYFIWILFFRNTIRIIISNVQFCVATRDSNIPRIFRIITTGESRSIFIRENFYSVIAWCFKFTTCNCYICISLYRISSSGTRCTNFSTIDNLCSTIQTNSDCIIVRCRCCSTINFYGTTINYKWRRISIYVDSSIVCITSRTNIWNLTSSSWIIDY